MVISLSEFNSLNEKDKKKTLQELKGEIGVSGLVEAWSVSRAKIYSMLHEFDVPVNPRKPRKSGLNPADKTLASNGGQKRKQRDKEKNVQINKANAQFFEEYEVGGADGPKFTLSLDTQGQASEISQTIQVLLSSGKFENTNLHMNLTLEEI